MERQETGRAEYDYIGLLMKRYPELLVIEESLRKAYRILEECYTRGGKVLAGGNGGSAADCEHFVGELMKGFVKKREVPEQFASALRQMDVERGARLAEGLQGALPAIAVCGHEALTSACGNDVDWSMAMAQQVYGFGNEGDVLLAVTTSGNSENLLYAADVARAKGMKVIGLTGKTGGRLAQISDAAVIVPKEETYQIQELHLPIYHAFCLQLEEHFFS
ncbi:MAG: D-sedoheptulose-7-phosphate isomerase [Stomatobaculum sp.]